MPGYNQSANIRNTVWTDERLAELLEEYEREGLTIKELGERHGFSGARACKLLQKARRLQVTTVDG